MQTTFLTVTGHNVLSISTYRWWRSRLGVLKWGEEDFCYCFYTHPRPSMMQLPKVEHCCREHGYTWGESSTQPGTTKRKYELCPWLRCWDLSSNWRLLVSSSKEEIQRGYMAHNWMFYSNTHPENFLKFHLLFITIKRTIWLHHLEIPDIHRGRLVSPCSISVSSRNQQEAKHEHTLHQTCRKGQVLFTWTESR